MKRLICGTIKLKQLLVVFIFLSISGQLSAQTITISTGGETGTSGTNWSTSGTNPVTISASGDATINTSVVQDYLNSGLSVIVNATPDIILSGAISKTSGNSSLTFNAGRDIFIQAAINSTGSALPVTFNADSNNDNIGAIMLSSGLSTNGGAIDFQDDLTFNGTAAQTVNSGVATITFEGEVMLSNTNGITLTTNDSNINFSKAVETELSPTPLTINAGAGTVTFGGAVGASNPLKTLTVTAATTAINGGSVTTNADGTHGGSGTQSYSGNITLGSASTTLSMLDTPTDFTLNSGKTITNQSGGDAALTIKTTAGIITGANSIISSSTGKLNTILWADTDANGGGIFVNAGASITSNGGDVTLSGGADYITGYARGTSATVWSGVRIDGSINSGTGSVLLRGQIGDIPANQNTLSPGGVFIVPSGSVTATSGNITLVGYVGTNVGSGNALRAIRLGDGIASGSNQASITSTSGNISLTGTTIPTNSGAGILFDSSKIQSSSGSITLTGQRGAGEPDFLVNSGSDIQTVSNQIISTSGNITVNANLLEVWGTGNLYSRFSLSGAGQLIIQPRTAGTDIGISGGAGTLSLAANLFSTSFTNGFSNITIGSTSAGTITLSGATTTNDPLTLKSSGHIVTNSGSTLTGAVSANASLVFWSDADYSGDGSIILEAGTEINTNGGHLWMGGGWGSTTWNGLTVGSSSAISINSVGIILNTPTINSGAGTIYLRGQSNSSAADGYGISLNGGSINSTSGMISLTGLGSDLGGSSINCDGLRINGTVQSENGPIIFTGYSNAAVQSEGIALEAGASITSTSGGSISLKTNIIYFNSAARLQSSGTLEIYPPVPATPIGVGGATGTLLLPAVYFTTNIVDGFAGITLGRTSQSGNINLNSVTFRDNMRLQTSGTVSINTAQTITTTGVQLKIDNTLSMGAGAKIVR